MSGENAEQIVASDIPCGSQGILERELLLQAGSVLCVIRCVIGISLCPAKSLKRSRMGDICDTSEIISISTGTRIYQLSMDQPMSCKFVGTPQALVQGCGYVYFSQPT